MFQCRSRPAAKNIQTDADLARYNTALVLAHEDCADQLLTIRNHLEINEVTISDVVVEDRKPPKLFGIF